MWLNVNVQARLMGGYVHDVWMGRCIVTMVEGRGYMQGWWDSHTHTHTHTHSHTRR